MTTPLRMRGDSAEQLVVDYLQREGYTIYTRNYTIKGGEVDIIAGKGELIAFVEVKMRLKSYFNLSLVVNQVKQRKIIKAALHYAVRHGYTHKVLRFDLALVQPALAEPSLPEPSLVVTFIPHAFTQPETL